MAFDPSTKFHFDFRNGVPCPELKLEGDAHYINGALRFTKTDDQGNPVQWSMGGAIYIPPVAFGANFETQVQFQVTRMENMRYGDGLAFFIVPEGYKFPDSHCDYGIVWGPGVFAVVFDIRPQNPIKLGICLGEETPKNSIQVPADFLATRFESKNINLKVSYNSAINLISASVSNGDMTFRVSFTYDLSNFLPPKVKVGLGSSTSEYVALHDAFFWDFKSGADPPATS